MNKEEVLLFLPLITALAEGKTIQARWDGKWKDCSSPSFWGLPEFWRIKPTPRSLWMVTVKGVEWTFSSKARADACYSPGIGHTAVEYREVMDE